MQKRAGLCTAVCVFCNAVVGCGACDRYAGAADDAIEAGQPQRKGSLASQGVKAIAQAPAKARASRTSASGKALL